MCMNMTEGSDVQRRRSMTREEWRDDADKKGAGMSMISMVNIELHTALTSLQWPWLTPPHSLVRPSAET